MIEVAVCSEPVQWTSASALVADYLRSFHPGESPRLNQRDEERLAQLRTVFGQGRCVLLLATESDVPVGCCGLGAVNRTTAELKRLYVQPDFRYRGVGQLLLERAVSEAQEFGYDRIVLDVVATRYPAIALYRKAGWQPIPHWEGRSDMVAFEWLIRT